ncbi:MAG: peroxiredoxin-like family protein [Planctomycetota bacterium]
MTRNRSIALVAGLVAGLAAPLTAAGTLSSFEPAPTAEAAAESAKRTGDTAPDVTLTNTDGERVTLGTLLEDGPVVMIFYRGSWCPICNGSLKKFDKLHSEFESAGATVIGVAPELPASALAFEEKNGFRLGIYSDVGSEAAQAFGVSYEAPSNYARFLRQANGDGPLQLPLGVTYVINTDRTISWSFVEDNYRKRAKAKDALEAVESIN